MENFERSLSRLSNAISKAESYKVDFSTRADINKSLINFKEKRKLYYQGLILTSLEEVKKYSIELNNLILIDENNEPYIKQILDLTKALQTKNLQQLKKQVKSITSLKQNLILPKKEKSKTSLKLNLPSEVSDEIYADIKEINKCFESGCYRSATVLCGRILETALHRKYYDVTQQDILEKNPGIGLGKLVAKLTEKQVKFEPGLTQQIHLINQVRISSVHKKQEVFQPSKEQAEAIILFTMDILKKLF